MFSWLIMDHPILNEKSLMFDRRLDSSSSSFFMDENKTIFQGPELHG
jgi:hypothetical protein